MSTQQGAALGRTHLVVGAATLAAFIAAGLYLRYNAPALYRGNEASHMMFRANFIYILMTGMAHLALGRYVTSVEEQYGRMMQLIGTLSMTAASAVLIYAYTVEPMLGGFERPRTVLGVRMLAFGVVLHLLSSLPARFRS